MNRFFTQPFLSLLIVISGVNIATASAQQNDSVSKPEQRWNLHFQTTVINQSHPAFNAPYSGDNSLDASAESHTSISSTLYLDVRLWKGAEAVFNAELSGGEGFSTTKGIAGFTNGEVYRVDSPTPKIFPARYYLKQLFALSSETTFRDEAANQLASYIPTSYVALYAGKFSMLDFFDANQYSHDPRTQFYNWALMGNGAWDYPADTRGYTNGLVAELVKPDWSLRFGAVMVPTVRNGAVFDTDIAHASSEALEFEKPYKLGNQSGKIRLLAFLTQAQMGNYAKAIEWGIANNTAPNLDVFHALGRTKYGFGINVEHTFNENIGAFARASWNDGQNETWTFTEIDRHASAGVVLNGNLWNRKEDKLGIAQMVDGISKPHQDYLSAGGYGFIIGDGKLNYGLECVSELYYSFKVPNVNIWLSPDYQLVINPAYNKDRGPVHAFGIRFHAEI